MKTYVLNLFIVNESSLKLKEVKNYLDNRFGTSINISVFQDSESMLKKIERYTNIVIMDYSLEVGKGNEVLKSINEINSMTEVIMLSTNEEIGIAIDAFQDGSCDYIIQGEKMLNNKSFIYKTISFPIRFVLNAFEASKLRTFF